MADLARIENLFFAQTGMDRRRVEAATAEALAKATQEQSKEYDIQGTPTFLVNGQKIDANAWPEVKAKLEEAGAR